MLNRDWSVLRRPLRVVLPQCANLKCAARERHLPANLGLSVDRRTGSRGQVRSESASGPRAPVTWAPRVLSRGPGLDVRAQATGVGSGQAQGSLRNLAPVRCTAADFPGGAHRGPERTPGPAYPELGPHRAPDSSSGGNGRRGGDDHRGNDRDQRRAAEAAMADRARHGRDDHGGKDRHRSEARGHWQSQWQVHARQPETRKSPGRRPGTPIPGSRPNRVPRS